MLGGTLCRKRKNSIVNSLTLITLSCIKYLFHTMNQKLMNRKLGPQNQNFKIKCFSIKLITSQNIIIECLCRQIFWILFAYVFCLIWNFRTTLYIFVELMEYFLRINFFLYSLSVILYVFIVLFSIFLLFLFLYVLIPAESASNKANSNSERVK